MKELEINSKAVKKKLVNFIRDNMHNWGFKRAVIGLSGGLDSTTTAYLAAEALGLPNLLGVIMPYKTTPKADIADAKYICKKLGIEYTILRPTMIYGSGLDRNTSSIVRFIKRFGFLNHIKITRVKVGLTN